MNEDLEVSDGGGGANWMATFADMMTLLLCFFILLLSFATMDVVKFRDALGSVQEALGVDSPTEGDMQALATTPDDSEPFLERPETTPALTEEDYELLAELKKAIEQEGLENNVDAEVNGRGVLLRINGRVLYETGEATLRDQGLPVLDRLAMVAEESVHRIMIEGHTDNVPINTARFPSNWELSTSRAIAAMQYLVGRGVDATRVGVAGYADQRPLESNDTPAERAANRRVEFVFIRETEEAELAEAAGGDATEETETVALDVAQGEAPAPTPEAN